MKVTSMMVEGCKPTGQFPNKSHSQQPKYQIVLCLIQVKNLVLGLPGGKRHCEDCA